MMLLSMHLYDYYKTICPAEEWSGANTSNGFVLPMCSTRSHHFVVQSVSQGNLIAMVTGKDCKTISYQVRMRADCVDQLLPL